DALGQEEAMEPEPVAAGLIAGDDPRVIGEVEPPPGRPDLGEQIVEVARPDGAESGLLSQADGECEFPGVPAPLQREAEHGDGRGRRIRTVSRRHGEAPERELLIPTGWSLTAAAHVPNSPHSSFIVSDPARASW